MLRMLRLESLAAQPGSCFENKLDEVAGLGKGGSGAGYSGS